MARQIKPDPYCGFKDDRERRLALLVRECRLALVGIASAVAIVVTALLKLNGGL